MKVLSFLSNCARLSLSSCGEDAGTGIRKPVTLETTKPGIESSSSGVALR